MVEEEDDGGPVFEGKPKRVKEMHLDADLEYTIMQVGFVLSFFFFFSYGNVALAFS